MNIEIGPDDDEKTPETPVERSKVLWDEKDSLSRRIKGLLVVFLFLLILSLVIMFGWGD